MAFVLSNEKQQGAGDAGFSSAATHMRPCLAAGVALVGASMIAVNPVAPGIAADIQERAVQLTGSVASDIGDVATNLATGAAGSLNFSDFAALTSAAGAATNPIMEWLNVFETSGANLQTIGQNWFADPFPALQQVVANQVGYADTIGASLQNFGLAQWDFITGTSATSLVPLADQMISDFTSGHISAAADVLNTILSSMLIQPAFNLFPIFSIPTDITGNLDNVSNALFNLAEGGKLIFVLLGALSPVFGTVNAVGDQGQAVVDAWDAGMPTTALTDLVNIPAVATNAFLNGYAPTGALGVLSPSNGLVGGLLADFVNVIPQAIAKAITPAAGATAAAALTSLDPASITADLAAAFDPAALAASFDPAALSMAFDPAAVTDIGSMLAAELAPNLSGIVMDLMSMF